MVVPAGASIFIQRTEATSFGPVGEEGGLTNDGQAPTVQRVEMITRTLQGQFGLQVAVTREG